MTATITTTTISTDWRNGTEKVAETERYKADTFEGTIDFVIRDKIAGGPIRPIKAPYDVIEYLADYEVSDAGAPVDQRTKKFDNFEDAVNYYFNLDSNNKVLYQTRKLSDGTTDQGVITYRWN